VIIGLALDLVGGYENQFALFLTKTDFHALAPYFPGIHDIAPYLIMIVVLFIRPYGLFGSRKVERV